MNLINGGKHADTNIILQEFQIIPELGKSTAEKIQAGSEIFHELGRILKKKGLDSDVGNEGGYAPDVESIDNVFNLLHEAIEKSGFSINNDIKIGIDAGSSSFYDRTKNVYTVGPPEKQVSAEELSDLYKQWMNKYNLAFIEDPFAEEAWHDWTAFLSDMRTDAVVIGDDLLATNKQRLQKAISKKAVSAILIKPNQIGTLSETIETIKLAQQNNIKIIISHRSGETNDAFISDLAVACNADYLKAGAPSRGERVAKYNRVMQIERELT